MKKNRRSYSTRGRAMKPTIVSILTTAVQNKDFKSLAVKVDSATEVKRISVFSGKTNETIKVDTVKVKVNDNKSQHKKRNYANFERESTHSYGSTGGYDDPTGGIGHIVPIMSYKKAKIRNRFKRVSKRTYNKKN